jgi:hypothetical protein
LNAWVKISCLIIVAVLGFGGGWYVRGQGAAADLASAQRDRAADQAGLALASAQTEAAALSRYQGLNDRLAAIDATHKKESADAKAAGDAVRADLERGVIRLRDEWATDRATSAAVQAAAGVGQPDARAALRAAGAGRLVQLGAQCDADIRGLQQALTSERAE